MNNQPLAPGRVADDWDPAAAEVLIDQVAAYDSLRERCPVAHSQRLGWSLLRPADAPVTILWPAVQHDPSTFPDSTTFRLDRDPGDNLLYGRGPHYCPGEGLSRLQLGVLLDVLFERLAPWHPAGVPVRAQYPAGGFAQVHIDWLDAPTPVGTGSPDGAQAGARAGGRGE